MADENVSTTESLPEAPTETAVAVPVVREPVIVARWVQLVVLPLAVVALYIVAKAAGPVLLLFTVAGIVALLLNPVVSLFERRGHLPRGLAVAAVYLCIAVALGGVVALLANPVADQATSLQKDIPGLVDDANNQLADLQDYLDRKSINIEVKKQGETALQTLGEKITGATGDIASTATDLLKTVVTAGAALILILVLSIYMLLYGPQIGELMRRVMPPGDGTRDDDYPTRVQRAVGGYLRAQLLFSLLMGAGAGLGMYVFGRVGLFPDGRTYAVAFGVFFGLMELVPFVGPFLGALPPLLVALVSDPLDALWVAIFFVALQQIEGHIVAPQVFGHSLRINPLLVIFALLTGGEVFGIIGALLALPIAAVLRETVLYLRRHLVLEPWGTTTPLAVMLPPPGPAPPGEPTKPDPDREAELASEP